MMNSSRAKPTPALGSWAKSNASWGLPTRVALGARDRDLLARWNRRGGVACADYRGDAELARDDRRVAGASSPIRDDGRSEFHHWLPVRIGHIGNQDVALFHDGHA
jgi:hypothetical protein